MHAQTSTERAVHRSSEGGHIEVPALEVLQRFERTRLPGECFEGARKATYVAYRNGEFFVRLPEDSEILVTLEEMMSFAAEHSQLPRLLNNLARQLNLLLPSDARVVGL